jgi:hypothetical protein
VSGIKYPLMRTGYPASLDGYPVYTVSEAQDLLRSGEVEDPADFVILNGKLLAAKDAYLAIDIWKTHRDRREQPRGIVVEDMYVREALFGPLIKAKEEFDARQEEK